MGLVADALDKEHAGRAVLLDDRLRAPWREDLLLFLGQREGRDVRVARRLEHLEHRAELASTPVDEDEVGTARERAVPHHVGILAALGGLETLQPSPETVLQHREVVGSWNELDLEMTVVIVARPTVLEDDHRPDRRVALEVGDVVALDALGRRLQVESLSQRGEHRLRAAAVVVGLDAQLLELLGGCFGELKDKGSFAPALRNLDRHRSATLLSQPAREQVGLVDGPRQDHLAWHVRSARVVLEDEAAEQLGFGRLAGPVERVAVVADHLALPDVGDLDEHLSAVTRVRDEILVVTAVREHLLPVGDALDRLELVPVARRILEVEPVGGAFHAVLELAHQQVRTPLHEQRDLVDPRLVVLRADPPLAWTWAALDVEVEANLALLENLVRAGPERKQLPDRFDGAPQRLGGGIRAEVPRAIVLHPARVVDARKLFGDRQLQIEVVLVVLEPDVEARPVVLDEVALEDQGLHLVGGRDELEVRRLAHELGHPGGLRVPRVEVLAQPVAEAQSLADIDDLALVVAKQVDARSVGDRPQTPLDRIFE